MTTSVARQLLTLLLGAATFSAETSLLRADEVPKPDPAGIATGDKTTAVDAAGNSFTVAAPADKNSPDYPKNKKDYDDFQSLAA